MPTNYPGSLDSLARPSSSTAMDATGYEGDVVVDSLSDAVEAVQAELGTDPAGVYSTVGVRLRQLSSADAVFGNWRAAIVGPDYMTTDPLVTTTGVSLTSQRVVFFRWTSPATFSATKLWWIQHTASATVTSAYIGIYSDGGASTTLLQGSASVASTVTSTGLKSATITSQSITAGTSYYFAFMVDASTAGQIAGVNAVSPVIASMEGTNGYGVGYINTGQTSLPASVDLTARSDVAQSYWFGISAA